MGWYEINFCAMQQNEVKFHFMKGRKFHFTSRNEMKCKEILWNEMKWNFKISFHDRKFHCVSWNEMKWKTISWNAMKFCEGKQTLKGHFISWKGMKLHGTKGSETEFHNINEIKYSGTKWSEMKFCAMQWNFGVGLLHFCLKGRAEFETFTLKLVFVTLGHETARCGHWSF